MNPMQTKLEQAYKEYLEYKQYIEYDKTPVEELRKKIAERAVKGENELDVVFEIMGEKQLELIDCDLLGLTFYNYYRAYKDFIEIPEHIKEEADKIQLKYFFAIKNGEREIADQEMYEKQKKIFLQANKKV